jgi:hypothetical protein
MEKRTKETTPRRKPAGKAGHRVFQPGILGSEKGKTPSGLDYFREAQLFLGGSRATLTFYSDLEVASIHYDMERDEIFYKGHNVKNMTLSENQIEALQKFFDYLSQTPQAKRLRRAYRTCLNRLFPKRSK